MTSETDRSRIATELLRPIMCPVSETSMSLERIVRQVRKELESQVALRIADGFAVMWYGAFDIDPVHLVYLVTVSTDSEKHALRNDELFDKGLRSMLSHNGYPVEAIAAVHLWIESQETVDRESHGDWHVHIQ